jgi:hypothetical protein
MNFRAFWNTEYVEVLAAGVAGGSTQQKFVFPDLPQIRTTPIYSIFLMLPSVVTLSYLTQQPLVTLANLKNAFLSLYTNPIPGDTGGDDKLAIDGVPLLYFNPINDFATPYMEDESMFAGQTVVWPKSYITLSAPIGNTTNFVFSFLIKYGKTSKVQQ